MAGGPEQPHECRAGDAADQLRRQAEARLTELSMSPSPLAPEDVAAVLHELQVHQIELEMQNDELRRAEEDLDKEREQYVHLFDEAPIGYLVVGEKGIVVNANLTAARLLGVAREHVMGQPFNAFVFAADRDAQYLSRRALEQSGEPQTAELRLYREGDAETGPTPFWARLEMHEAAGLREGEPRATWVTVTDVDESVAVQQALLESDRIRSIAERVALVGSWSWDLATKRATWSDGMFAIFDVDPADFDADVMPMLEARVHPDDRAPLFRSIESVAASGASVPVEFRVLHRDGSEHTLHAEATTERSPAGEPVAITGYYQDVTRQRQAGTALREMEAIRDLSEELAHLGSTRLEFPSLRAVWSPGMYALMDVDPGGFDGDSAAIVEARVHPDDREMLKKTLAATMETGETPHYDFRVVWRDGSVHVIHRHGDVEVDGDGKPVAQIACYREVTEERAIEAQILGLNDELEERVVSRTAALEATNKELESFAYSVSHDLRAPLRTIDGFSQMVVEDAGANLAEADVEHLQRVRVAAQRMASLIDDLLGLSRVSSRDMLRDQVDVSAMAEEVLAELREQQPGRQVVAVVAPGITADADSALLRVILYNLLANAWKFTGKHPTASIEVGVTGGDGKRAYFVRDDGAGFDQQYATHLFGAFQRMHRADEFEGDGIGLATVQRLVTRHGGRVWAEAEIEKGATFFFTLPEGDGEEIRD
jgi:PAS domain S-box-containing protein